MKYVVLLRGVNVGGKSKISMSDLKDVFEKASYTHVKTYINSGNIIFETTETSTQKLTQDIENLLSKNFSPIDTVVLSDIDIRNVLKHVPSSWKSNDVRKYIAFVRNSITPQDVIAVANVKENVDAIDAGPGVVYMTTKSSGLTKSSFPKLAAKPIYKQITIRNYNTVQKLAELMETE
jgi:uncharacterized protein (DUF1697 family)